MSVTQEIQKNHIIYGASDYTAPGGLSASKSLNYANGPSIARPDRTTVSVIPYTFRYADSVGLFGAENYFLRVDVDLDKTVTRACFEEVGWECAYLNRLYIGNDYGWTNAAVTESTNIIVNTYEPGNIVDNRLPSLQNAYLSIDLKNIKTGNKHQDDWLDIRLYTSEREEHPYDTMYIKGRTHFYIGVHARNTKRIPYDIICTVGQEYLSYEAISDKRLVMKRNLQ